MAQLLLAKTLKKKASSKSSSLSKKLGICFVLFSVAIGAVLSDRVGVIPKVERVPTPVVLDGNIYEDSDIGVKSAETVNRNYSTPEEQLDSQDEENDRLLLQRDVNQKIKSVFIKPFNYKNGFSCTLKVTKDRKLVPVSCDNNQVYLRSIQRALDSLNFKSIEKTNIKTDTFLLKVTL